MAKDPNSKDAPAVSAEQDAQLQAITARADAAEAAVAEQTARADAAEAAVAEQTARADAAEAAVAEQTARADAAEAAVAELNAEGKQVPAETAVELAQGLYVLVQGAIMSGYLDHPHKDICFKKGVPVEVNPAGDSWFAAQVERGYIEPFQYQQG